jgi:hypothetical protein
MVKHISILSIIILILLGCSEEKNFPFEKGFPLVTTLDPVKFNIDEVDLFGEIVIPAEYVNKNYAIEVGFIARTPLFSDTIFIKTTSESVKINFRLSKRYYRPTTLHVLAFAKLDSVYYLGLEKKLELTGKPFSLSHIIPDSALWQDTIRIIGSRLDGYPERTTVSVLSTNPSIWSYGRVIAVGSEFIDFIMPRHEPSDLNHVIVQIERISLWMYSVLQHNKPKIHDFFPEQGFQGDTVTITGIHFGHYHVTDTLGFDVRFGGHLLPIVSWKNNEIKVRMNLQEEQVSHFTVRHLYYHETSQSTFHFLNP